jgi:DNA-binding NarL/FixJ family response regulator
MSEPIPEPTPASSLGPRTTTLRVAIAEDSVLLRAGIARLVADAGNEVVADVGDAAALLHAVAHTAPDVCVIDVRLPPDFSDEGIRAATEIRARHPQVAVLVLSQYVEERYASDLLADGRVGGVGYLLKDRVADVAQFIEALHRVAAGGTALDPEVVAQLLVRRRGRTALEGLTPREAEVLGLMAEGRSNAGIAEAMVVSAGAVEKHVNNIFTKLGLLPANTENRRVLAVLRYLEGKTQ